MKLRRSMCFAAVAFASVGFAACGSDDDSGSGGGSDTGSAGGSGGSGEEVAAADYVKALCTNLGGVVSTGQEQASAISSAISSDPANAASAIGTIFSDYAQEARDAATAMGEAGYPDIEDGEAGAELVREALDKMAAALEGAAAATANLSSDPAALAGEVGTFSTQLTDAIGEATSGLSGLKSDAEGSAEMQELFTSTPECASIAG